MANTMPGPLVAALDPASPRRTDTLRARILKPATDVDGDPLVYRYRWTLEGKPLPLPLSAAEVPASGCSASTSGSGSRCGPSTASWRGRPPSPRWRSATRRPARPRSRSVPARPRQGEALRAVLTAPAEDADADPLTYTFTWTKNGQPLPVAGDGREVPGAQVQRGDRFEVTVQAFDGEEQGPKATAVVTAVNTPAGAAARRHRAAPSQGRRDPQAGGDRRRPATPTATRSSSAWPGPARGSRPPRGAETLAPSSFRKHERVRVIVTPTDGKESGVPATDEVVVENAPPSAPAVVFGPVRPDRGRAAPGRHPGAGRRPGRRLAHLPLPLAARRLAGPACRVADGSGGGLDQRSTRCPPACSPGGSAGRWRSRPSTARSTARRAGPPARWSTARRRRRRWPSRRRGRAASTACRSR